MNILFPAANPCCIFDDEENQTYESFVEIGNRNPNAQGTGRFKLIKSRREILVVYFGSKTNLPVHLSEFLLFLSAFVQFEVQYEEQLDAINHKTRQMTLDEVVYDISVATPSKKKARTSQSQTSIDVFSLFDVLVHKAKKPFFTVVGLFDSILTEDGQQIIGRACGDRVCCISLPYCSSIRTLMATTCHEVLRTMGFDHNTVDRCVMNAIAEDEAEWLFLSRLNIQELQLFHHGKSNMAIFFEEYHSSPLEVLQGSKVNHTFREDIQWLKDVIQCPV